MKRSNPSQVVLDGSYGEGGGTLVRVALAMSALTQQAVTINQVRSGTRYPGLDTEDVALALALKEATGAEVSDLSSGQETLAFAPKHSPRGFDGAIGTVPAPAKRSANALILLNTVQSVLVHSGVYSEITAEGETFGNNTLSYDSYCQSTVEALKKFGCYTIPKLREAAFGRESVGVVELAIEPSAIQGVDWGDRGQLESVTATVSYARLAEAIPQRAASHLITLSRQSKIPTDIEVKKVSAATPGIHVALSARFERGFGSGSAMGTRGVRVEAVATGAFEQLYDYLQSQASVDAHLADQLLLTAIFAQSPVIFSVPSISRRLLTAIWVAKQFMPLRISVTGEEGHPGVVKILHG